ncbi:MAG: flagellar assembly protein FliH [Herminiimonas sp.]|nr:flagellar assembly protein FliH [Herminiimonas sp.]
MSDLLPKEQQSAYQRWEMASFGDERPSAQPPPQPPQPARPNIEEIALIREEAHAKGFNEGIGDGFTQGHAAGLAAGRAEAAQELLHLQQIAEGFGTQVASANELIAEDLLNLALDLSKAMLKSALKIKPEIVLSIVGDAIRYLPTLQQPAILFLNADDAVLVRENMGEELSKAGWRVVEELHMERGGCRVETASNQIDASAPTRWQRISAALGKESDWLAQ